MDRLQALQARADQSANAGPTAKFAGMQQSGERATGSLPTQRKLKISGVDNPENSRKFVNDALDANEAMLKSMFADSFEKTREELRRNLGYKNIIYDMTKSPVEYGQVNLANPQHVAMFFHYATKYTLANYKKSQHDDKHDPLVEAEQKRDDAWKHKKRQAPPSARGTYRAALLGTGASVAYYLNANRGAFDPAETVIIGKVQPWDSSNKNREGRGIDFVNHPMNMISPDRDNAQLPQNPDGSDETFQGNPAKLSEQITEGLKPFRVVNAQIGKIRREAEGGWYIVETNKGNYAAEKVVAGLGIGAHKKPDNKKRDEIKPEHRGKIERVMDLDEFQRQLQDENSDVMKQHAKGKKLWIGVAGPNAGVDAVHTATNKGMYVEWVVSGGPAVVEGMGNSVGNKALVDLYFNYLSGWTVNPGTGFVTMHMGGKWRGDHPDQDRKSAEDAFMEENSGWYVSRKDTTLVDFLVQAQGPDVAAMWDLFDNSATADLGLVDDNNQRFGGGDRRQGVEVGLWASQYNVYWEGIRNHVLRVLGEDHRTPVKIKVRDALATQAMEILEVTEFAKIRVQSGQVTGLATDDKSLEIIGGSAIRVLDLLDGYSKSRDRDVREKVPTNLRGGRAAEGMKAIIKTLSTPSIVMNDQLTPTRSQLEAEADYMPGYVGSTESNFVTDDQTMIAAQIAGNYSNIPPELANWITQKIIEDRHANGVKPGTSEGSRSFQDRWNDRLVRLHTLFAQSNVRSLAEQFAK